jgi:hypothetical protein
MKRRAVILGGLIAAVATYWLWQTEPPVVPSTPPPAPASPQVVEIDDLTVLRDTPFDLDFTTAGGTPEKDLELVQQILADARLLVKDHARIPLADNRDFTRFLSGQNPHRVAWIRPGHPQVNAQGELTDRWGTPIFFHQESSSRTSLRSAGPDKTLWTDDDFTLGDSPTESP